MLDLRDLIACDTAADRHARRTPDGHLSTLRLGPWTNRPCHPWRPNRGVAVEYPQERVMTLNAALPAATGRRLLTDVPGPKSLEDATR
jgi:hypothetical protein